MARTVGPAERIGTHAIAARDPATTVGKLGSIDRGPAQLRRLEILVGFDNGSSHTCRHVFHIGFIPGATKTIGHSRRAPRAYGSR